MVDGKRLERSESVLELHIVPTGILLRSITPASARAGGSSGMTESASGVWSRIKFPLEY